jgi:hypothetical protein
MAGLVVPAIQVCVSKPSLFFIPALRFAPCGLRILTKFAARLWLSARGFATQAP